jgi:LPPG:FO 2-phospho-L-lactate transferase
MMRELGLECGATEVARRYADLLDVFVVDEVDAATTVPGSIEVVPAPTLMTSLEDRDRLARLVLAAADRVARHRTGLPHLSGIS